MSERVFALPRFISRPSGTVSFFAALIISASAFGQTLPKLGSFYSTFYYVLNETAYPAGSDAEIKASDGKLISKVHSNFKKDLDIEGTGILRNGQTVNFARLVDGEARYKISTAKWGWGVGNCPLKPYRTIAVDPRLIRLGTTVYIPAAKGMELPDGGIHDGIFYAEDVGSGIQARHIDFFAKEGAGSYAVFGKAGINTKTFVDIYKVKDPDPKGCQSVDLDGNHMAQAKALATQLDSLRVLADEYAAQGKTAELNVTLEKMHKLHLRWEWFGEPLPTGPSSFDDIMTQRKDIAEILKKKKSAKNPSIEADGSKLKPGEVVITFNDGPHGFLTPAILKILDQERVKGTFFQVGRKAEAHPDVVKQVSASGHEVANHSYYHAQMTRLIVDAIKIEVIETQNLLKAHAGTSPLFFRAPYGMRDERVIKALTELGFRHVLWNIDSLDWFDDDPQRIEKRIFTHLALHKKGVITLHDNRPQTLAALPKILQRLKKEGYKFLMPADLFSRRRH